MNVFFVVCQILVLLPEYQTMFKFHVLSHDLLLLSSVLLYKWELCGVVRSFIIRFCHMFLEDATLSPC